MPIHRESEMPIHRNRKGWGWMGWGRYSVSGLGGGGQFWIQIKFWLQKGSKRTTRACKELLDKAQEWPCGLLTGLPAE